jgi:hypothetical protein
MAGKTHEILVADQFGPRGSPCRAASGACLSLKAISISRSAVPPPINWRDLGAALCETPGS